jgi:hypothetical protein
MQYTLFDWARVASISWIIPLNSVQVCHATETLYVRIEYRVCDVVP